MFTIGSHDKSFFEIQDNSWDSRSLNIKVFEIVNFANLNDRLFLSLDEFMCSHNVNLCVTRIHSDNLDAKKQFLKNGFFISESSFVLLGRAGKIKTARIFSHAPIDETESGHIIEQAVNSYSYTRFHEDPFLQRSLSIDRLRIWHYNLLEEKRLYAISDQDKKLVGCYAFEKSEESFRLQLLSIFSRYSSFGAYMLQSIVNYHSEGIKYFIARVSAANISALNIYFNSGFIIKEHSFDYHKHYLY